MSEEKFDILLVEDDTELAQLIKDYLEGYEFNVSVVHDGDEAEPAIAELKPDLLILDLMLPGKDGITICKDVRPHFQNTIVMLTASNETIDHILGLEIGADEYLSKPIEPRILLAHLRALLRRQQNYMAQHSNSEVMSSGNIEVSPKDRMVRVDGNVLSLTQNEYELILLLISNKGEIISRNEVFMALKNIEYDGMSRFADILVSQLRNKIGIDGISEQHIKTVRNKGYLFVEQF